MSAGDERRRRDPADRRLERRSRQARAAEDQAETAAKHGGREFYWIAALSLVNSIKFWVTLDPEGGAFVVGLGITLVVDYFCIGIATAGLGGFAALIAGAVGVAAAWFFALMGFFARRGHTWAFVVGLAVYALDALLLVALQAWLMVGFHALVAVFVLARWTQMRQQQAAVARLEVANARGRRRGRRVAPGPDEAVDEGDDTDDIDDAPDDDDD